MKWKTKTFYKLTNLELYKILQLRSQVFVVEQDCIYQDLDDKDQKATHIFLKDADEIVTYLRVFKPGDYFENAAIGRIVTHPKYRGNKYGVEAILKAINHIINGWHEQFIEISAQKHLKNYYNRLGFEQISDVYLEDGIPHIRMLYNAQNQQDNL
jgi:ElaA protein